MTITNQHQKVYNNPKSIQPNNNQHPTITLTFKVDQRTYDEYIKLRDKRMIRKDSVLLRPLFKLGLITGLWLDDIGLLSLNTYKLEKITAGLSLYEKMELLDILKSEIQV